MSTKSVFACGNAGGEPCCGGAALGTTYFRRAQAVYDEGEAKWVPSVVNICSVAHLGLRPEEQETCWRVNTDVAAREEQILAVMPLGVAFAPSDARADRFFEHLCEAGHRGGHASHPDAVQTHLVEHLLLEGRAPSIVGGAAGRPTAASAAAAACATGNGVIARAWELRPRPETSWVQETSEVLDPPLPGTIARVYSVGSSSSASPPRHPAYDIVLDAALGARDAPPTSNIVNGIATFIGSREHDIWPGAGDEAETGAGDGGSGADANARRDVWRAALTEGGGVCQLPSASAGRGDHFPSNGVTYFWSQDAHGEVTLAVRVPPSVVFDARADVERGARRISISWRRPQHAGAPYTLTRTLFAAVAPPRRGDAAARIVLAPDGSYAVLLITLRKAEAGVTRAWPALSADDAGAAGSAAAAPNARGAKFFPGDRVTARAGWIRISMDNPSDGVDVEAGSAATGRAAGSALRSDCAWICPYGTAHGSGYSPDDTDVAAEAPLRKAGSAPALGRLFLRQFLKVTAASQLLTAVKCGDSDVVRTLLVRDGIDVSVAEADTGLTPIMAACQAHLRQSGEAYGADAFTLRQLDATLRLLLEHANAAAQRGAHGGDGGDCDDGGYAARHVRRTRLRSVIDAQDGSGNSALHYACWAGRLVAIQLLLDPPGWGDDIAGASLFSRDLFGRTPMHAACWQGHDLVACMLLRRACALPVENVMADFSMDAFSGEAAPSAAQPGVETRRACDYVDTVRFVANDDAASGEAHGSESAAAAAAAAPRTWLDGSPNRDGEPLTEQTVRIDVSNLRSTEDAIRALLDARATAFAFPIHMAGMLAGPTPIDYMILNNHEVPTGTAAFVLSYKNPGFKSRALRRLHSNPRWRPIIATPETANDALLDWARHLSLRGFACSRDEYDEHGGVAGRTQRYGRSKGTVPPMKTAATIRALLKEDLPFAAAWAKINGARGSAAIESAASGAQGDGGWLAATARQHGIGMEEGGIDVQKLWLSHFAELDATMGASEAADDRVQIFTIAKETDSARLHRTWWRRPDEVRAHDDGARAGSFAPLRVVSAPGWARDATAAAAAAGAAQRAGASPPRCLAYAPHAPSGRSPDETHEPGMFFVVNGAPGTDAEKYGYRGESRMYTFGLYPCVARRFRQIMSQRYIKCFVPPSLSAHPHDYPRQ